MDAFVSARVPVEIKQQVADKLAAIGATQTDLVNAAFSYVMQTGRLPQATGAHQGKRRQLSTEQRKQLRARLRATTFDIPESAWKGKTHAETLEEKKLAAYEALS